ncbi:hypothetical protein AB1L88_07335 [Tautonia sp. JC769]|uniref:hypothetical protein n=1 Tax=Tautonia sp. JC769 TaxID=3232135 RepID=UPI0034587E5F
MVQEPISPGRRPGAEGPKISSRSEKAAEKEAPLVRRRPTDQELATWSAHFKGRETSARDLLETVVRLKGKGQMAEVEAALRGYLDRPDVPKEAWMYQMLAVIFDYNQAEPAFVQQALGYAAMVADRPGEEGTPESLLTIVDLMAAREVFEIEVPLGEGRSRTIRVADLLDHAADRLPGRADPWVKSLDLAERQLDADRMARAVEGLMALGWPGVDDAWRNECRLRTLALAKRLREAGRASEADSLIARLEAAEPRDLYARLTWNGFGDLDLLVEEPLGATARLSTPRTVFGGALIKNGRGSDAEEVYVCPRGFDGTYRFRIEEIVSDPDEPITAATLEVITHEGGAEERVQTFAIDPRAPKPVEVTLEGGRRTEVLPYVVPKMMVIEDPEDPLLPSDSTPENPNPEPSEPN